MLGPKRVHYSEAPHTKRLRKRPHPYIFLEPRGVVARQVSLTAALTYSWPTLFDSEVPNKAHPC